ncbi:unnamed protein product [Acanthoscelides obtectus]|uniref:Aminopeptidase P N-terminal domain-containing protein n=1 Tax=Acanthoscelides obtectus TaxID=200917 RepID=A0A9P0JZR6_ACAOB|nr:unnamed protein product [Acanthoscelides obtectus]CAK1646078.1 Xaa-Pro dipeptidase [Acanthoscelides obtectus]
MLYVQIILFVLLQINPLVTMAMSCECPLTQKRCLNMGPHTYKVPLSLFQENRERLVNALKEKCESSVVLLQGGDEVPFYDTDITYNEFRQESYFMWSFGVTDAGCYGAIDVKTGESYVFFPRYPEEYAVWMGPLHELEHLKKKYAVDHTFYVDQLNEVLQNLKRDKLLTLVGAIIYEC